MAVMDLDYKEVSAPRPSETRKNMAMGDFATEMSSYGFAQINGPFRTSDEAFDVAGGLVEMCRLEHGLPPRSVIGDFVVPPLASTTPRSTSTCSPENYCYLTTWPSHTADAERANPESCVSASSATTSSRGPEGSCATTS